MAGTAVEPTTPIPAPSTAAGGVLPRRRDLDLLAWTGEQYAARVDQLAVLLGCGPRTVQRAIARLREARLAEVRRLLAGEPAWMIPTVKGMRACGLGFAAWRPRLGLLAHVAAVNDVRLHVSSRSPGAEWVCERVLACNREDQREHLPDAVVITGAQRVAIEVELTIKSRRRLTAILDELVARHDATLYFCAPGPHRVLNELSETGRWPTLGVRTLPAPHNPTPPSRVSL